MTVNKTEKEEKEYLVALKEKIDQAISAIDESLNLLAKELYETKKYLYENKAGMDHVEKVSVRQSVTQGALTGEAIVEKKKRLQKLLTSPYFGRIDFSENGHGIISPIYIGIHSFLEEENNNNIIHDWRAPISSMYYDFELGKAWYDAPGGRIDGKIYLKRQYRIRNGKMEYMLENSMNIHDEILQKELSKSSDAKMKDIVATIQRDQNAIIRNEVSRVLIIQGVAGSGKTSIALHRIAFLLYRFRENIRAKEVLIISPNKIFADYISNVLPELGEEKIPEMGMEELANNILEGKFRFQTFFEQVSMLLDKKDEAFINRIRFKSTSAFLAKLEQYMTSIGNENFKPVDIWIKKNFVPEWFIRERYEAYHRLPLLKRFSEICRDIEENIRIYYKYEIDTPERNEIRKAITGMFKTTNLRELYKDFYQWLGKPELFKHSSRSTLEYSDVFPLIFLKIRLEGFKTFDHIKHLLVDEMQDYTALQYAVLAKLFPCKKTLLGDANQSVNPYSFSTADEIQTVFTEADKVILRKSYRSTFEIASFAQKIHPNEELIAIERHGEKPVITIFKNHGEEFAGIRKIIEDFSGSELNSLGIICKTQKQARELFEHLDELKIPVSLLTNESASFAQGVVITSVHLSKGLEFDQVIVPFATDKNYHTDIDKSMLYIACTRAMHKLHITYVKNLTDLIGTTNSI